MNLDLRFYAALFLRRIHYFLILLALGGGIGITLAIVLPPVYRAEALLLVENQQIPDELAATTVQTETTEQLQIIQQRILTRDSLLEMANRLSIYAPRPGEVAERMPADEIVEDMRDRPNARVLYRNRRPAGSGTGHTRRRDPRLSGTQP